MSNEQVVDTSTVAGTTTGSFKYFGMHVSVCLCVDGFCHRGSLCARNIHATWRIAEVKMKDEFEDGCGLIHAREQMRLF